MTNEVEKILIQPLYDFLQQERFVTIATIDFETGGPNISSISWILAPDKNHILFAVDNRSRIVENIRHQTQLAINIIANESTYAISGKAIVKLEKLSGVPLKLALIELTIDEVRDVMFYGSKISVLPKYEKTYDIKAATKLDNQVMTAIREI